MRAIDDLAQAHSRGNGNGKGSGKGSGKGRQALRTGDEALRKKKGPSFLGPVPMRCSAYFMTAGAAVTATGAAVSAFLA